MICSRCQQEITTPLVVRNTTTEEALCFACAGLPIPPDQVEDFYAKLVTSEGYHHLVTQSLITGKQPTQTEIRAVVDALDDGDDTPAAERLQALYQRGMDYLMGRRKENSDGPDTRLLSSNEG